MIVGVGHDICATVRFSDKKRSARFVDRWFAPEERDYIASHGYREETIAGIFAAKEATLKALGLPLFAVPLCNIIISHNQSGAPLASIDALPNCNDNTRAHISITHDGGIASAVCVIERL